MTGDDNKLLESFFAEASHQEIPEAGFSRRVIRRLPSRAVWLSRLWTSLCLVTGIILIVSFDVLERFSGHVLSLLRMFLPLDMARLFPLLLIVPPVIVAVASAAYRYFSETHINFGRNPLGGCG